MHMTPTNTELFELATERLSGDDLEKIEQRCNQHTAPSVRSKIEDEFTRMREAIEAAQSEAA